MITSYELFTVTRDHLTADMIIWQRYKMKTDGLVEALLDANPHLALIHKETPILPIGTQLRIPIDPDVLKTWPGASKPIALY